MSCVRERGRRLLGQLGRRGAVQLLEQPRSLVEMERADLQQLVARTLGEPAGKAVMQVGAGALRETAVRDLADEHVLELERVLAGDGRSLLEHHEVAPDELLERAAYVLHLG